ncbi:membrane protein insertase YidC [Terracidiphilus gabretensis]|uniref:membrane protein insertase YidC n=1 Tax=Terracidiphilus gabretensis TaxID=1577687 RepID=UPI00071BCE88|nr:membrane protein insertase YidC [Terracidiphilus gabretensis]
MPEFQNPNLQSQGGAGGSGGGGGDLRSMLAIGSLGVAVFFGYQIFFNKPKPETQQPAQTQQQSQQGANNVQTQSAAPSASPAAGSAQPAGAAPGITAGAESETTVQNANYKIVFTNRGAQVKHWYLLDKHYQDSDGHQLDLVQKEASDKFGKPLSLYTYDSSLTSQLNSALYQVTNSTGGTGVLTAPGALTFHYEQNGLDVIKTFNFDSSYVIHAEFQVRRNGQPVLSLLTWPAGLGDMEEFGPKPPDRGGVPISAASQITYSVDGKTDSMSAVGGGFLFWAKPEVSGGGTLTQPFEFAALSDLYFAAAFLPDVPARTTMVTLHNTIDILSDPSNPNSGKKPAHVVGLAVGDTSGYTSLRLYAGPKQTDLVSGVRAMAPDGKLTGPTLHSLIQYGWLTIIATPLFWALRFLNEHGIPNWGWDIIILTAIFNLIMLPTRIGMMKSSLKMQRIQPRVDAIKRKYANLKATDPKRAEMNQEMMALYKTENINMYGSCLPLLIQMPLFFAYFRVLQNAVELRQAHWGWLTDLSTPDPLHILPIVIIVTMLVTQLISPAPGMDPAQRRMMAIMMPLIFGFTLWHYPSGLALYWCTGNLINFIIQISINNSSIGKELQVIAAKRAAKRNAGGGNGKTIQGRR